MSSNDTLSGQAESKRDVKADPVREASADLLLNVTCHGRHADDALLKFFAAHPKLTRGERSFTRRLTYGTLERLIEIDYIIDAFSKVPTRKMKPFIRCVMENAVYQIKYMDSVPASAAVNEAVNIVKKRGFKDLSGFVNAVLRRIAKDIAKAAYPDRSDESAYLSVRYSCPVWIVREWLSAYGRKNTEAMLAESLKEKPLTVRCCLSAVSVNDLILLLKKEGAAVTRHPYLSYALNIDPPADLEDLTAYKKGYFYVQDVGSMLAAHIAGIKKRDFVIDVCAAPGGKALHAADILSREGEGENSLEFGGRFVIGGIDGDEIDSENPRKIAGRVLAGDISKERLNKLRENAARLGLTNIDTVTWDAAAPDPAYFESADVVMADLPCSGLGVMGRKPDLKLRVTGEDTFSPVDLQRRILAAAGRLVKPGGVLIYSVCTLRPEENEKNAKWFTDRFDEFRPEPIADFLCDELKRAVTSSCGKDTDIRGNCIRLMPGIHESDGFFIAKFKKRVTDVGITRY